MSNLVTPPLLLQLSQDPRELQMQLKDLKTELETKKNTIKELEEKLQSQQAGGFSSFWGRLCGVCGRNPQPESYVPTA